MDETRCRKLTFLRYQDAHLTLNHAVEIIGKVMPDLSVKVFTATDFGTGIGEFFVLRFPGRLAVSEKH